MVKKCLIMLSTLTVALLIVVIFFTSSTNAAPSKIQKPKTSKATLIDPKLISEAKKLGINVKGLNADALKAKIAVAKKKRELEGLLVEAKELGIDVKGTDSFSVKSEILSAKSEAKFENLLDIAKELGVSLPINSTDVIKETDKLNLPKSKEATNTKDVQQVIKKGSILAQSDLLKAAANKFQVDIIGLSEEDGWVKINKAFDDYMKKLYAEMRIQAEGLGIDIVDLSDSDALTKVMEEKSKRDRMKEVTILANKYGVDITGLSEEDAVIKIKTTSKYIETEFPTKPLDEWEILKTSAGKLGVDITGLSLESAKAKVKEICILEERKNKPQIFAELDASAKELGVDISNLYSHEASEKIIAARKARELAWELENRPYLEKMAKDVGVDITGLTYKDASALIDKGIEENRKKIMVELVRQATELGIDITGLSIAEANTKIDEARKAAGQLIK